MEGQCLGVRKGAWFADEDLLLTRCIHDHGEGDWHLIPKRAGLNRCRKSCRLRWLNYLSPRIKRGIFDQDEIDLIIRLHKLLGNRWSLIAGRIPGRTANDVKNFWNTHLKKTQKSICFSKKIDILSKSDTPRKVEVIKPQARTFSNTLFSLKNKPLMIETQTKKTPYLLEHDQSNLSSIWNLKSPYNEVCANILDDNISLQQRDDDWQQYLSNSTCLEIDNVDVEQETLPQVNHHWDEMSENIDIWNILRD